MNKVILMGRLTRDPDIRYSQGERQMAIARYTLAVDRRRSSNANGENTADFIQCVAFDRAAEFAEKYFHQGIKIAVVGHVQNGSYTNRDGQKVYTTEVIIEDQEFAESKAASDASSANWNRNSASRGAAASQQGGSAPQPAAQNSARPDPSAAAPLDGFMNIPDSVDDDGLPFN